MSFEAFSFGSIRIDGVTYEHDVVIDHGHVRKRKKKASKKFRGEFGHTPLSVEEEIPWDCRRLVIGAGGGAFSVGQYGLAPFPVQTSALNKLLVATGRAPAEAGKPA